MRVTIAHRDRNRRPRNRKALAAAVRFYCKVLIPRAQRQTLHVHVVLDPRLRGEGLCSRARDRCSRATANARTYCVRIRPRSQRSLRSQLISLAHECTHVAQMVTGRLEDRLRGRQLRTYWRGQHVPRTTTLYHDLPWETEAWAVQYPLANLFRWHRWPERARRIEARGGPASRTCTPDEARAAIQAACAA